MWIIWKKIGIFDHYLDKMGSFYPKLDQAKRFTSKEMADIMAKKHGGIVRVIPPESNQNSEQD